MFHKVKEVIAQSDYSLRVKFIDGNNKEYDVKVLINKYDMFKDLEEIIGLFQQVTVDVGGYGISWNDQIDISCDELWKNGKEIVIV